MSLKQTNTDLYCVGTYNPIYTVGSRSWGK